MFEAVVVGASAGGMRALKALFGGLPTSFAPPIAVVLHIDANSNGYLSEYLGRQGAIPVKEAEDKEAMQPDAAYLAPPYDHLLAEPDASFSLSVDEKVNYCRPAIEVLFESAAALAAAPADYVIELERIAPLLAELTQRGRYGAGA